MDWECGTYWGREDAYKVMVGKPEGKRPIGRPKYRQEDNIKMDLQGMGWKSVDWIDVVQVWDTWWAVVIVVMNLWVALNAGNFLKIFDTVRFPRWALFCGVLFIYLFIQLVSQPVQVRR